MTSIINSVKDRSRGQWSSILTALSSIKESPLTGKHGPCPICGGKDRFKVFDDFEETGGAICNQCGPHSDGIATVAWLNGLSQGGAARAIANHIGLNDRQNEDVNPRQVESSDYGDPVLRDLVYRAIIAECPLSDEDRADLRRRGLSDASINRNGYGSLEPARGQEAAHGVLRQTGLTENELCCVPGVVREKGVLTITAWLGPGLLVPCRDADGRIQSLKVRRRNSAENQPRYVSLSGGKKHKQNAGSHCHAPSGTPSNCPFLRVTEGELKADVTFALTDVPTISVPGIGQWRAAIPVLESICAEHVLIAYDAPEFQDTSKATARDAVAFSRELIKRGFRVEIETWEANAGKGIDDVLVAGNETSAMTLDGLLSLRPDLRSAGTNENKTSARINSSSPDNRTELANSRRFVELHGDSVRYCFPWKTWFFWDGKRWTNDRGGYVERCAKDVPDAIWHEALNFNDEQARKFASASASARSIRATLELARSELPLTPDEMDRDSWLLNCRNGTLDLRTGRLEPWDRDRFITCLCPTEYDPDAESPIWNKFLSSTFGGDADLIEYLQRFLGYCLTGQVNEQMLAVMYGEGANGKSTLLTAFMEMLGTDYAMKAPHDLLLSRKSDSHPTALADLHRKRFAACVETPDDAKLNEALVKELTGGDRIRARGLYQNFFEFPPTHKLVLCTNYRPRITGTDHGMWRRVALIPFTQHFWDPSKGQSGVAELQIDSDLTQKLIDAREAILAWCVRGCLDWKRDGMPQSQTVRQATAEYRQDEDVISQWLAERCTRSPESKIKGATAYRDYVCWCETAGERAASNKKFGTYMKKTFESGKSNGVYYRGVGLSPASDESQH
jgi:putative DNA primase/helicase